MPTKKKTKTRTSSGASAKVGYVDGFVLVVPKKRVAEYKKMAKWAGEVWMKHGALGYKECMGDDLDPDMQGMKQKTFPKLAGAKKNETVWFSFITYKNKKHRDQVNVKVMADPKMQPPDDDADHMKNMPFDMKRFSWGGFSVEVDAK